MKKRIVISGFGKVAREIVRQINEYKEDFIDKYDIEFDVCSIIGSTFTLYQEKGIDIDRLLEYETGSEALRSYCNDNSIEYTEFKDINGDILIESTPTNIYTGEPGYTYIKWALEHDMDIVSVSKGALVKYYDEIMKLKSKSSSHIKYSGATMAALPAMDLGYYSLSSTTITEIVGILNGTSNFILTEMYNNDTDINTIIQKSIKEGISEKNIDYDINGIDTANKLYILSKSLMDSTINYENIKIEGIEDISIDRIREAKKRGNKIKLLGIATKDKLEVKPVEIDSSHPLYSVEGKEKDMVYYTKDMGKIVISGGESSPRGAASSAIKDMINIYRK